jgi:hypothetical protein
MPTTRKKKTTTSRKTTAKPKAKVCKNCGRKMTAAKKNTGRKPAARKPVARKKTTTKKPASRKSAASKTGEKLRSVPARAARFVVVDGKRQFQTSSKTVRAARKKIADLQEKNPRKKFRIYDIK